jgi:1,4-alpha-glucan branching enzyme
MRRIALTLHAHLPFYPPELDQRNPAGGVPFFGSHWLLENTIECYLPLLRNLKQLDGLSENKLNLSFSPVLMEQLMSPKTRAAVVAELEGLIDRAKSDARDRKGSFSQQAQVYQERYSELLEFYLSIGRDVLGEFSRLTNVELMTTSLTHAFLPLLKYHDSACAFQISEAARQARRQLGKRVVGFWFPEMGYTPCGRKAVSENFGYFLVAPSALGAWEKDVYRNRMGVRYGVVDLGVTSSIWHPVPGFGGPSFARNAVYREFYKWDDSSGLKYWCITGQDVPLEKKTPYSTAAAERQLEKDVVSCLRLLSSAPDDKFLAMDAEFFGHHWYEGADFLSLLLRRSKDHAVRFVANSELLSDPGEPVPEAEPRESCWGGMQIWTGPGKTDSVRTDILARTERATSLFRIHQRENEYYRSVLLNRLLRELVAIQASDYAFVICTGRAREHYDRIIAHHRASFDALAEEISKRCSYCERTGFLPRLRRIAKVNYLFRDMDYKAFPRQ